MEHHLFHHHALIYYLYLPYGVAFVPYMFWTFARLPSSWLLRSNDSSLQFREPKASRLLSFFLVANVPLELFLFVPSSPYSWFIYTVMAIIFLLGVYLSGPRETFIDGQRRVYVRTEGWPWKPRTRTGSLDEFDGIRVTPYNKVMLFKKGSDSSETGFWVDAPNTRHKAQEIARQLSAVTNLPIVITPLRL